MSREIDAAARKVTCGGDGDHVIFLVDAPIPQDMAARYKPGANWTRIGGQRALVVKHLNGLAYLVSWTLPAPPERTLETEGLRLLDEAVAERNTRLEVALVSKLVSDVQRGRAALEAAGEDPLKYAKPKDPSSEPEPAGDTPSGDTKEPQP